jgi:UPF0716 protein FxsA
MVRLFLILLVVPVIEIALFIEVGGLIGTWPTVAMVILTTVIGTVVLRRQGLAALRAVQGRLAAGEDPGRLLADGAMVLLAGALLLAPGFFTDAVGLALLVPAVRGWLWNRLAPRLIVTRAAVAGAGMRPGARGGPRGEGPSGRGGGPDGWGQRQPPGGRTIEGEYEEIEIAPSGRPDDPSRRAP